MFAVVSVVAFHAIALRKTVRTFVARLLVTVAVAKVTLVISGLIVSKITFLVVKSFKNFNSQMITSNSNRDYFGLDGGQAYIPEN